MQRIEKLAFDGGENQISERILSAWRILGGAAIAQDDPRAKPIRRIRGNDFTESDLRQALATISEMAAEMRAQAETGTCPYPEQPGTNVAETWREGLRTSADLALREAEGFLDRVDDALVEAGFRKLDAETRASLRTETNFA